MRRRKKILGSGPRTGTGALLWLACRYCGDDVQAPEDTDTVTCARCVQTVTGVADPESLRQSPSLLEKGKDGR